MRTLPATLYCALIVIVFFTFIKDGNSTPVLKILQDPPSNEIHRTLKAEKENARNVAREEEQITGALHEESGRDVPIDPILQLFVEQVAEVIDVPAIIESFQHAPAPRAYSQPLLTGNDILHETSVNYISRIEGLTREKERMIISELSRVVLVLSSVKKIGAPCCPDGPCCPDNYMQ